MKRILWNASLRKNPMRLITLGRMLDEVGAELVAGDGPACPFCYKPIPADQIALGEWNRCPDCKAWFFVELREVVVSQYATSRHGPVFGVLPGEDAQS